VNDITLVHKSKPIFSFDPKQPRKFKVKHSPGEVTYEVGDFLVKNRDVLARGLIDLMQASSDSILRELFVQMKDIQKHQQGKTSVGSFYLVRSLVSRLIS